MEGRNYIPSHLLTPGQNLHPQIDSSRQLHHLTGDRTAVQHREMQSLLFDNQRLAAIHVSVKRKLSAAKQELRHLSSDASNVKAERDAEVHEVYERSVKMEAEVRSIDALSAELAQIVGDVQKLSSECKELTEKVNNLRRDTGKASFEWRQVPLIESEIESMQKEIERGRAAIEHEKKVHASNIEQSRAMEKHWISMAREIEKLQTEVVDAEKRARAAAAAEATSFPG